MIDLKNITVRYGESSGDALASLSLHVNKGEYVAIIGPNGSGKSTLIKALCGLVGFEGEISLLEKDVRPGYFAEDFFGRVGCVFQEPESQFLMRDVETEIVSVLQNLGLSIEKQRARFAAVVGRFNLSDILAKKPENLSGGQMQLVNLACALATEPEIVLLDEPVTYLDRFYRKRLLDHLDSYRRADGTIFVVAQNIDEAARADRICILDNGHLVEDCPASDLLGNLDLMNKYNLVAPVGIHFKKLFGFDLEDDAAADRYCLQLKISGKSPVDDNGLRKSADQICSSGNLGFHYDKAGFAIDIDNLNVFKGEVIGLVGANGSGKSTLAFLLAGLLKPLTGNVEFRGKPLSSYPIKELRKKIGIAWQLSDLALLGPTVQDDIEFIIKNLGLDDVDLPAILKDVALEGFENRIVDTLSGGEKRKLSLAGILTANPEVLILDEPTAFLDPPSRSGLVDILRKLVGQGKGILIAGHDLQFISNLANRILGIKDGRIILDLPAFEFFSNEKHSVALGLPPDPIIKFRQILAERGYQLPFASLEPESIKAHLDQLR